MSVVLSAQREVGRPLQFETEPMTSTLSGHLSPAAVLASIAKQNLRLVADREELRFSTTLSPKSI